MRPLQQILSDINELKANETQLYRDIDDVQAKIIALENEKKEAEFWIKQKLNK